MGRCKKRMKKTVLAWMLTLAMVLTGISLPGNAGEAQAEAKQLEGVNVTVITHSPGNDWAEYKLSIQNGTSSAISNFVVKIPVTSGNVVNVKAWGVFEDTAPTYSDNAIILHFSGTINAGETFSSGEHDRFGFGGGGATLGTAQVYEDDGSFGSGGGGGGGSTINPDLELEYNFAKAFQYSLYLYDANMCGSNVKEDTAFTWRGNCHLEDQTATYNGKTVDVSGGYHDAGDHVKFNLPQAYSASTLGIGYYEFKDAFTELGQDQHMKIIMDRFAEYFENCTILDNSGKVEAYCYQVGEGNSDHGYWGPPEDQTSRQGAREAYFTSSSTTCTDIVGETAAALAIYAVNYKTADKAASDKALKYAKALFEYAESNTKGLSSNSKAAGFYNGSRWEDDMALASIWLYKATGDSSYQNKYNTYVQGCQTGWVMSWDDVSAAAYLYGGKADSTRTIINNKKSTVSPQGFAYVDGSWGSARYNTALQLMGLSVDKESNTSDYKEWALGQMQYLMGSNKDKRNFIVGYNENSPKYIHHRAASGYGDVNANATTPLKHTVYGALAGGPNDRDNYIDKANEYQYAEVAIDYNAGFVGALAGLYLQEKDGQFKDDQYLATSKTGEMKEVTIYYGEDTVDPNATPRPVRTPKPSSNPSQTKTPGGSDPSQTQTPGGSDPSQTQTPGGSDPSQTQAPGTGNTDVITDPNIAISNGWSGGSAELAEQTIMSQKSDKDIAGSVFGSLKLRATKTTKNSVKLKWNKVSGASKYIVYGNRCGKNNTMQKLATVTGSGWTHKSLKKGTYYKYLVMACQTINEVDATMGISKTVHATTLGGKKGNAKKVTVKKAKISLKKGKSFKIKAKQVPLKKKNKIAKHRKISYESSNSKIATVSSSGKIKAKKKGKCTIYVYAQNGLYKQVKVTIK
ncbi:MAG: glycoside hydrolase family 9 protein [Lachnospiraceae bacterium]|nr:glycoside hydrolase family 9 protein [Lachnospiraceae bacterium]